MTARRFHFIIYIIPLCLCQTARAQDNRGPGDGISFDLLEMEGKILLFVDNVTTIAADIPYANMERLNNADKALATVDNKWNIFYQAYQTEIASDETLLGIAAKYQEDKQALTDSIQSRRQMLESMEAFLIAEKFLDKQKEPYQEMENEAAGYAQVEKMSPMLEKLKVKEQLAFAEIEKHYGNAKTAAQQYGTLELRMKKVEENYIELKRISDNIQAAEYKPFIERIKDYLLSFAAVAILLMFINMVQSKIQSYRQLRKSAEEYKKAMQANDDDIPSI